MDTIKIGFDDDDIRMDEDPYEEDELKDGPKVKSRITPVYVSPERFKKMQASFDHVVVHEFGDEYHLSEEERNAKNAYYETFKRLRKAKKTYRHIDEYVEVMRIALNCLDAVAETNGVYDPDEFKLMFLRGEIYINGLKFPKYKGRDKKNLSWDYIAEFIVSGGDPNDLLPSDDEILTQDELLEMRSRLFTEQELAEIFRPYTKEEEIEALKVFDPEIDTQEGKNIATALSDKETKKLIKKQPELLYEVKEMRRAQKATEKLDSMVYDLVLDDLEMIARYDARHGYESSDDMPEFNGNLFNDSDFKRYMYQLQEFEDNHIKENYGGKMKTPAEIREAEVKSALEKAGWDIRALYGNREREKKLKEARKRDEAEKKKLKKKLAAIDKRNARRVNKEEMYTGSSKKKKKGKKKKKKTEDE